MSQARNPASNEQPEEAYNTEKDFQDENYDTSENLLAEMAKDKSAPPSARVVLQAEPKPPEEFFKLRHPADMLKTPPPVELPDFDYPSSMMKSKKSLSSTAFLFQQGVHTPETDHKLEVNVELSNDPVKVKMQTEESAHNEEITPIDDDDAEEIAKIAINKLNNSL